MLEHGLALVRLEQELARTELARKGRGLARGTALAIGAGVVALYAVGVGIATLVAALSLLVDWWLALLIVFLLLLLLVVGLLLGARSLVRASAPLGPVQAIEEARATRDALRGSHAD